MKIRNKNQLIKKKFNQKFKARINYKCVSVNVFPKMSASDYQHNYCIYFHLVMLIM